MRALIVADIHGNIDALEALEAVRVDGRAWDRLIVLGDLVDYGPCPGEVIEWIARRAGVVVRGNHDHAMATGADCRSSSAFVEASIATREYFRPRLDAPAREFLEQLPLSASIALDGGDALAVHATPRETLYEYLLPSAEPAAWREALAPVPPATRWVLVGHTHVPFVRQCGSLTVVNPGSLGMPKDGDPRAVYAVFEDGAIALRRVSYDIDRAVDRLERSGLASMHVRRLSQGLRTGRW